MINSKSNTVSQFQNDYEAEDNESGLMDKYKELNMRCDKILEKIKKRKKVVKNDREQ